METAPNTCACWQGVVQGPTTHGFEWFQNTTSCRAASATNVVEPEVDKLNQNVGPEAVLDEIEGAEPVRS